MADSKRTEKVMLYLRPEEKERLDRAAEDMGVAVAVFGRLGALEKTDIYLTQRDADRNAARRQAA